MIYALVILLGLAISFSEKLHLFKLPFSIGKVLIIIALLFIGGLSWFKEFTNNNQIDRIERNSDSIKNDNKSLSVKSDSIGRTLNGIDSYLRGKGLVRKNDNSGRVIIIAAQKFDTTNKRTIEKGLEILGLPTVKIKSNATIDEYSISICVRSKTADEIYVETEHCLLVDAEIKLPISHSPAILMNENPNINLTPVTAIYKFHTDKNTFSNTFFIYYEINRGHSNADRLKVIYKVSIIPKIQLSLLRNGVADYNRVVNYVEKSPALNTVD